MQFWGDATGIPFKFGVMWDPGWIDLMAHSRGMIYIQELGGFPFKTAEKSEHDFGMAITWFPS